MFSEIPFRPGRINRQQQRLFRGGTISGIALNLAFVMGASKIRLFGCTFSYADGHYFYPSTHVGKVRERQLVVMQQLLKQIRGHDVVIDVCGRSRLV